MSTVDNTHGAELIAEYAKTSGAGFDKTRAYFINTMNDQLNVDVTDAFSVLHVGIAKLIKEVDSDIGDAEGNCSKTYTALAMILSVVSIMQAQHTINEHTKQVNKLLAGAPKSVLRRAALLSASPQIRSRGKELGELAHMMTAVFMGNVVRDLDA